MHCRDIRRRIEDRTLQFDSSVTEHLQNCPGCRQLVKADAYLTQLLDRTGFESDIPSLEMVRKRVTCRI